MKITTRKLVLCALFLALALVLPFLTAQIPQIGGMLLPMHLPVLLCGFVCGGPLGALVGAVAPLLRSAIFGMPPIFPTAVAMAFELAAYGFFVGLFYKLLPKKPGYIFAALALALLLGRAVWGLVQWILVGGAAFTFEVFLAGAFVNAFPGIILQFILVPLLVLALKKANLLQDQPASVHS